jgi:hypothetical protein
MRYEIIAWMFLDYNTTCFENGKITLGFIKKKGICCLDE